MPAPLVGGGVDHVGVVGGELEIGDPGVLVDGEARRPGGPAVGRSGTRPGLLPPTRAALRRRPGRPCRPRGSTRIRPMCSDLASPIRLPGPAGVPAPIDAGPPSDVPAADVLAGADPDDVRIGRLERDLADRVGGLLVEDRRQGHAAVGGLPDPARPGRHVPRAGNPRVHGDVGDPPAGQRRADPAQGERGGGLGDRGIRRLSPDRAGQGGGDEGDDDDRVSHWRGPNGEEVVTARRDVGPEATKYRAGPVTALPRAGRPREVAPASGVRRPASGVRRPASGVRSVTSPVRA